MASNRQWKSHLAFFASSFFLLIVALNGFSFVRFMEPIFMVWMIKHLINRPLYWLIYWFWFYGCKTYADRSGWLWFIIDCYSMLIIGIWNGWLCNYYPSTWCTITCYIFSRHFIPLNLLNFSAWGSLNGEMVYCLVFGGISFFFFFFLFRQFDVMNINQH